MRCSSDTQVGDQQYTSHSYQMTRIDLYCVFDFTAEQAALTKSWEEKLGKAGQEMEQVKSDLQRLQEMFDKQVQELKDTNKKQAKTAKVSECELLDTISQ